MQEQRRKSTGNDRSSSPAVPLVDYSVVHMVTQDTHSQSGQQGNSPGKINLVRGKGKKGMKSGGSIVTVIRKTRHSAKNSSGNSNASSFNDC